MKTPLKACILGGTGFVGRQLVPRLIARGYECHVPSRRAHRHRDLKLYPGLAPHPVHDLDDATLSRHFADCALVVNLVGILNESAQQRFEQVHVELVGRILQAARDNGVDRLLHVSTLNADKASANTGSMSRYLASKGAADALVLAERSVDATVFRPAVLFGRDDSLFNRLARLVDWTPGVIPLACARSRFAPLWVGDLAEAMVRALDRPETIGKALDLCGPRTLTLAELIEFTARLRQRRPRIIALSDKASWRLARLFERLPGKPFTTDQYRSLQVDGSCANPDGLLELGIQPTDIDTEVPRYLGCG